MEKFRDIKDYEGLYKVSDLGNVKSLKFNKERIRKASLSNNGYLNVGLCKNGVMKTHQIHVLVAIAFLGHTPCGFKRVVNHMNTDNPNNKLDNRVENLEIVTNRENTNRKHLNSTSKYVGVSWHKTAKKWQASIKVDGKRKWLGLFTDEIKAHEAYQKELNKVHAKNGKIHAELKNIIIK